MAHACWKDASGQAAFSSVCLVSQPLQGSSAQGGLAFHTLAARELTNYHSCELCQQPREQVLFWDALQCSSYSRPNLSHWLHFTLFQSRMAKSFQPVTGLKYGFNPESSLDP